MNTNVNEIEPLKWAIKYNPAKIALEYYITSYKQTFLLDIDLEEKLKIIQSPQMISDLLYKTYPDVLNKSYVQEDQLISLINKIVAHRKVSPSNKNSHHFNSQERFPTTVDDSKFYSKSNQNFFSTSKNNNINFIDQTDEDVKAELNSINKNKRGYDIDSSDLIRENSYHSVNDKSSKYYHIDIDYPTQSEVNSKENRMSKYMN